MGQILKGAPVAAALSKQLLERAETLKAAGIAPTLAILRVGQRLDDISYKAVRKSWHPGTAVSVAHSLYAGGITGHDPPN